MHEISKRFVTEDGTSLAWDEAGQGAAVLLLHGIGSSRQRWQPQMQALVSRGYRAVRLDLRGFGESEGAEQIYGMDELVFDVSAFVETLGVDRLHLVGHSLGGMIAQRYTIEHPLRVQSLVLASTTSHNGQRATAFARAMELLARRGFDAVISDPVLRPEVEATLAQAFPGMPAPLDMLRIGVEEPNPARANAWRACIDFSTKDQIGAIRCPVLVLHGSADPLIPFRAGQLVHEAIAHSEWVAESGAGHSITKERAESFNHKLLDFLSRAASS